MEMSYWAVYLYIAYRPTVPIVRVVHGSNSIASISCGSVVELLYKKIYGNNSTINRRKIVWALHCADERATFVGHLLRDDLLNPVKMSVRISVRTSTIKLNAATNQIVVFVKVDETFTTTWLSRLSEVMVKIRRWPQSPFGTIFLIYSI